MGICNEYAAIRGFCGIWPYLCRAEPERQRPEDDVLHFLGKDRRLMVERLPHHNIHPQRYGVIV